MILYPTSSHVQFHELEDKTDTEIWGFARTNDFCIVTQDADFAERSRLYALHPKSYGYAVAIHQPDKLKLYFALEQKQFRNF
jgi:hypothetical protein